ncbi:hypothetical protein B4U80_02624 [Leptotrombidium deliense]|uniref:Uncharacterized protein n=1 Tax=Leptotrombidium deliense TaxID=299467 RepID=A0A443S799_9ACAR|nr:hypothetical protein B4U80_02624 [Leptotrombidium deliense]
MTGSRVLIAENEFIRLLKEANVEPNLILNDNVKVKLMQLYKVEESSPKEPSITVEDFRNERGSKRRNTDVEERNNAKRLRTEMPVLHRFDEEPIDPPSEMPRLSRYDENDNTIVNTNKKRKRSWVFPDDDSQYTAEKLYKAARLEAPNLTLKDVKKWLKGELTYTLHKPNTT